MDHSVSLLYRPKILQRLMDKTATTAPMSRPGVADMFGANSNAVQPSDELITAMNE